MYRSCGIKNLELDLWDEIITIDVGSSAAAKAHDKKQGDRAEFNNSANGRIAMLNSAPLGQRRAMMVSANLRELAIPRGFITLLGILDQESSNLKRHVWERR